MLCPVCKGKGYLFDHLIGVMTLGLGYLVQLGDPKVLKDRCYRCDGDGFVHPKEAA